MRHHLLTILRNKHTGIAEFRTALEQWARILAVDASEHLKERSIRVKTPIAKARGALLQDDIVLVPILRSGLAFLPTFLSFFQDARVGFIGLKRDEQTAEAHLYYSNIPPIGNKNAVIVLDPMLATGGSAVNALTLLVNAGAQQKKIIFVSLIASPQGVKKVHRRFPDVTLVVGAIDAGLTKDKWIVPGVGDVGDRYFGTISTI